MTWPEARDFCAPQKGPLSGCIGSFQIHPRNWWTQRYHNRCAAATTGHSRLGYAQVAAPSDVLKIGRIFSVRETIDSFQKRQQEKFICKGSLTNICSNVIMWNIAGNPADNRIIRSAPWKVMKERCDRIMAAALLLVLFRRNMGVGPQSQTTE